MSRSAKKTIYGIFYLTVLAFVIFIFYNPFPKSAPVCTGTGCNQTNPISNLEPLKILGIQFFGTTAGQTVVLADALNTNQDYGVQNADYEILVYDKSGDVIETVNGQESFRPSEEKHIFNAGLNTLFKNISNIDLTFANSEWQPASKFTPQPNLSLGGALKTSLVGGSVRVAGTVVNQAPFAAVNVKIIALIFNRFSSPIFASQTFIPNLAGGSEGNFVVVFPADSAFNKDFDSTATQIFFSSQ